MAKLPEEVIKEIYNQGYNHGRADTCREMIDTINFLSKTICVALENEIKELTEKNL